MSDLIERLRKEAGKHASFDDISREGALLAEAAAEIAKLKAELADFRACETLWSESRTAMAQLRYECDTYRNRAETAEAEAAELRRALGEHQADLPYVIGWNHGFAHAVSDDLKFPTMLRKMWSGGEVQKWLDEQFAEIRARAAISAEGDEG